MATKTKGTILMNKKAKRISIILITSISFGVLLLLYTRFDRNGIEQHHDNIVIIDSEVIELYGSQGAVLTLNNVTEINYDPLREWILLLDSRQREVYVVDTNTWTNIHSLGGIGQGPGEFLDPYGFAIDPEQALAAVFDEQSNRIIIYNYEDGVFVGSFIVSGVGIPAALIFVGRELWVSRPRAESLITRYSVSGDSLGSFGEAIINDHPLLMRTLNTHRIAIFSDTLVAVTFMHHQLTWIFTFLDELLCEWKFDVLGDERGLYHDPIVTDQGAVKWWSYVPSIATLSIDGTRQESRIVIPTRNNRHGSGIVFFLATITGIREHVLVQLPQHEFPNGIDTHEMMIRIAPFKDGILFLFKADQVLRYVSMDGVMIRSSSLEKN